MKNHLKLAIMKHYNLVEAPQADVEAVVEEALVAKIAFGEVAGVDATIYFPGEELTDGTAVYSDEALEIALEDGDYELENGDVLSVAGGIVTAIAPAGEEVEEAPSEDEEAPVEAQESLEEILAALAPIFENFEERIAALEVTGAELSEENVELKKTIENNEKTIVDLSKKPAAPSHRVNNNQSTMLKAPRTGTILSRINNSKNK